MRCQERAAGQHTYVSSQAHYVFTLLSCNQKRTDSKYVYTFEFIVDCFCTGICSENGFGNCTMSLHTYNSGLDGYSHCQYLPKYRFTWHYKLHSVILWWEVS